ncbi:MAG: RNA polymerase sigma factor [Prolixibacteraceae bacterium]
MSGQKTGSYNDEKLMQFILSGDQQAFNELYRRYNQRLYYYFFRMLGNSSELANDFLQDLFLKIIENPARFNPGYSFKTWIFSVAYNMCKNEYRRQEIRKGVFTETDLLLDPVLPQEISKEELVNRIFLELDELGPEQRTVFIMHYREGFQINEIASVLEMAPGTVKSRLFYTRKYLAEKLQHFMDQIEF